MTLITLKYAKEVYQEAGLIPVGNGYRNVNTGQIVAGQAGDLILETTLWKMAKEEMIRRHV